MCKAACSSHTYTQHAQTHTYTATTHIHTVYTHTHKHAHTARQGKGSNKYTEVHTLTHTRAHTVLQHKGSDTLAELRCYVFKHNGYAIHTRAGKNTHTCAHTAATLALKHNGSAIATRAGKNTNARAHTAATLAQVRLYVFKHNCSTIDKLSQVTCSVYRL